MAVMTSKEQMALEALRREEEERERARRRDEIESEMSKINLILGNVKTQIYNLASQQTNLNTYMAEWGTQNSLCNQSDILSEVVIVNVFEGVCADKIKQEFRSCVSEMGLTCSKITGLNDKVSMQISRLNQYATLLRTKLTSLNNELNSL